MEKISMAKSKQQSNYLHSFQKSPVDTIMFPDKDKKQFL
ncbi:hypothetical protein AT05_07975 [Schleiferia thermophila str. Yellowstone]|nr:hypothetical protein AT05_07975 [Schleiferia thermophila str. Yellowstone]